MNLITKILLSSKEEERFLSIWNYEDEKCWFGQVLDFNDEVVIFQNYTKFGWKDGVLVLQRSEIKEIGFGDDYERAMIYVIENHQVLEENNNINLRLDAENWQKSLLEQVKNKMDFITSVKVNGDYYSGFITEVDEEHFMLHCIAKNGEDEGKLIFKIADLQEFSLDDKEDRRRYLLYQWRLKNATE